MALSEVCGKTIAAISDEPDVFGNITVAFTDGTYFSIGTEQDSITLRQIWSDPDNEEDWEQLHRIYRKSEINNGE